MKQRLRYWSVAAVTLLSSFAVVDTAYAEGSRELTPNSNNLALTDPANTRAGYLTHDAVAGAQDVSLSFLKPKAWGPGFSADHRMYIRLQPGERLAYGVQRINFQALDNIFYGNLVLTVRYGNGFGGAGQIVQQTTLSRDINTANSGGLLTNQAGVIGSAAQAQAGPSTLNPAGYTPLTYTNTTGATQDFWVEFTGTANGLNEFNDGNTQPGFNDLSVSNRANYNAARITRAEYPFWDFTVIGADNQEKKGRLFSKFWAFSAGLSGGNGFENRLSSSFALYPLIPSAQNPGRYYVKQFELAGMRPYVFYFVSNANGTVAYDAANNATTQFSESRKSRSGRFGYPEYSNFVNDPDQNLWPSAPAPNFSRTYQPFCNSITGRGAAAFTTTSEETGSVNILIDLNNNGVKDGNDVLLEQTVTQANIPVTTAWDGRDAAGGTVATGTAIRLTFTSTGAPVNFPIYDAEGNPDGYRVQNIRPSSGGNAFFDRLYWDDRNLTTFPATPPAPDNSNNRLDGVVSSTTTYQGVHRWGDATNEAGNDLTINTWTYGFISAAAEQSFIYTFNCDYDNDGVADAQDLDDDNDGISDLTESNGQNPQTYTLNGQPKTDGTGVPIYLDAAYVTPNRGAWRDVNADGINDLFDVDLDGIPNHIDLDADGDGITDAREANGGPNPTGMGVNGRINNSFLDLNKDGMDDRYQAGGSVVLSMPDTDGDGRTDLYDLDSDNDGILDMREAQSTAAYIEGNSDADKDGLADQFDQQNGGLAPNGVALNPVNTEGNGPRDYRDTDSDNDAQPDWIEGFDENQDGAAMDDLNRKAQAFALANPNKTAYYPIVPRALSPFLADADADGQPNFLDPQSAYYHDDNQNGLVDLFDPAYGGSPSVAPKRTAGQADADFRSAAVATPLPVELISFQARAAGRDALLTWATASEKDNAHFDVERSADGVTFAVVGSVRGNGTRSTRTDYAFTDKGAGAAAGTRYYRLRQVDLDGKESTTEVRVVSFDGKGAATLISVYPSPSTDKATLDLLALSQATYQLEVLGADGRRMLRFETTGGREVALPVAEFAKGTYMIRVSGQGQRYLVKLLKN
ncbi:T9SS type A sorting domain-containing protein [Hymenobacter yonginensis]|uniref:T9SS type A sorting domain-containing protein n=1 Tax=Hymenobacter yonginensis TaxID=748197 RepID=A0ABY7PTH9_9BACT|nr:T9SS type A sorting domain-containing protein [Hymenobacter yonginensis]WBO86133.1 T9SS type A sorting domain-containing protein [Hymenobacter yonginensis]